MSSQLNAKFRPVLTSDQISHICNLARRDSSKASLSILSSLAQFEYKIKLGAVSPAYAAQEKQSLEDQLGFSESLPTLEIREPAESANLSSHSDESLYQHWLENPDDLSIDQLARVHFYRYTNGKMVGHEEREYEAKTLGMLD
jgi:hypothetical protein